MRRGLLAMLWGLLPCQLWAAAPIVLDDDLAERAIGRRLQVCEDPTGQRTHAELVADPGGCFVDGQRDELGYGYRGGALWLRFTVVNPGTAARPWVLLLNYAPLDDVQLYWQGPDGAPRVSVVGDARPFAQRPLQHRSFAWPLEQPPGAQTLYLRVAGHSPLNVPLRVYSPAAFAAARDHEQIFLWLFYGLMLAMLGYNLFLFGALRQRSYLYYVVYIAGYGLFLFIHNGLAKQYWWPDATGTFNNQAMMVAGYLGAIGSVQFGRHFLHTVDTAPRLDRVLRGFLGLGVAGLLLCLLIYLPLVERGGAVLLIAVVIALLIIGVRLLRQGYRPARFYVAAWSAMLLGVALGLLKALGVLPVHFITDWGYQIGCAVEALLLSMALADRINTVRADVERLNVALESKVVQRTHRLSEASAHLEQRGVELEAANLQLRREMEERQHAQRERNTLEGQLRQSQKMEAIGRLAGGVAHDMNNMLGAIMGFAVLAEQQLPADHPAHGDLHEIVAATARGRELTSTLLGFTRKAELQKSALRVNGLVEELHRLLARTAPKHVELVVAPTAADPRVEGDANQLLHALMNLCVNALDAMPSAGTLTVATRLIDVGDDGAAASPPLSPGRYAVIEVRDTGEGMDADTLQHAVEPFFTTKPEGQGTGLGLAIVYGTLASHGGAVWLDSAPGQGTIARLFLPASAATGEVDAQAAGQPEPARGSGTVLVVDDERSIRLVAERMLCSLGYQVLLAESGVDAVTLYTEHWQQIDLVMLDLMMPEHDGFEVVAQLQAFHPEVRVLICTGFSGQQQLDDLQQAGIRHFLRKPFDLPNLAKAVALAIAAAEDAALTVDGRVAAPADDGSTAH